ncbi:hypothetical protein CYMTET_41407 [Cymbomonas tetramitiformis]|uniref:Band 7 domain-containing protein n=1 Tax=Cymbomonas tetramitiformis TaxID=36881 RepID=A0AAE0F2J6_9CHLO|nr:hypothetical protein CYMTET_41407 [Cymbomonas tetramitiformis]
MTASLLCYLIATLLCAQGTESLHMVQEGYVGIYFRGGKLLETVVEPGLYLHLPWITKMVDVQVRLQTDVIRNVPCGTKDGILSEFERVEVVNSLSKDRVYDIVKAYGTDYDKAWIHDKIHHEINQFCSNKTLREVYVEDFSVLDDLLKQALQTDLDKYARGVAVMAVRMTKPSVPLSIRSNYEAMEEQRTAALVAEKTKELVQKQMDTERLRTISAAEKDAEESAIKTKMEAERARAKADTKAYEEKLVADTKEYAIKAEAAANQVLLTDAYLLLQQTRVWEHNTKAYFGERIPNLMIDTLQSE